MISIERALAALVLVACIALLVRGVLPAAHRARVDAVGRRFRLRVGDLGTRLRALPRRHKLAGDAEREAEALIERVKRPNGDARTRPGEEVRPPAFKGKREGDRPLH